MLRDFSRRVYCPLPVALLAADLFFFSHLSVKLHILNVNVVILFRFSCLRFFFNTHLSSFLRSFLTGLRNALCCLHWRDSYTCRNEYKYSGGCSQKLYWSYSVELVKPLPFVRSALVSWPQLGAQSEFVHWKCSVKNKKVDTEGEVRVGILGDYIWAAKDVVW